MMKVSSFFTRKRKGNVRLVDFLVDILLSSLSPWSLKGWKTIENFEVAKARESST